jgi:hypothetical protein
VRLLLVSRLTVGFRDGSGARVVVAPPAGAVLGGGLPEPDGSGVPVGSAVGPDGGTLGVAVGAAAGSGEATPADVTLLTGRGSAKANETSAPTTTIRKTPPATAT